MPDSFAGYTDVGLWTHLECLDKWEALVRGWCFCMACEMHACEMHSQFVCIFSGLCTLGVKGGGGLLL